jgi:hypothetical protein
MPATFSWVQYTGSTGNSTTFQGSGITATSSAAAMSWDFETADNTGTVTYTANPVSAGSASFPVWIKGYWTNTVAYTVSNLKFWQFNPAASSANTASFTIFGQTQTAYSIATSTATGVTYASNVAVPTSTSSTGSPGAPITGLGSYATNAAGSGVNGTGASGTNTPGGWLSLQLSAAAAAPAGTTGYFGFTLQYDEQ